jgi:DNA polymerase III delta prime subunit
MSLKTYHLDAFKVSIIHIIMAAAQVPWAATSLNEIIIMYITEIRFFLAKNKIKSRRQN